MSDGNRRLRRLPAKSSWRSRRPPPPHRPIPMAKPRTTVRILRRYSSEPVLLTVRFLAGDDDGVGDLGMLPRFHTCSLLPPNPGSPHPRQDDEAKVVVSVTVERSPGPVRAMVRLGSSVEEAIRLVLDRYGREGRSPRLDWGAAGSFQLHHSHFSIQSLNKSDKIGEVGGRSFYLRKDCSICIGSEGADTTQCSETELLNHHPPDLRCIFFAFIAGRLSKIGRRTRKLWKVVACIACSS